MRLVRLVMTVVLVAALGGMAQAGATAFDDQNDGEWDASTKDTWGTGVGGDYPGKEYLPGPPEVPDPDTATIDSNTVTGNVAIRPEVSVTVGKTATKGILNTTVNQDVDMTLDGGQLRQQRQSAGSVMNGDVTVETASETYALGHSNTQATQTSFINGDIKDGATTGQLHVLGQYASGLVVSGDNSGFSGGFLVDAPGSSRWSRPGLGLGADGALGTGDTTVNSRMYVQVDQTDSVACPAPNKVTLASGSVLRFRDSDGFHANVLVTNWEVYSNGATIKLGDENSGFAGGNLYVNAETTFLMEPDGRWMATGNVGCTLTGSAAVIVKDDGTNDNSQNGLNDWARAEFTADNSTFSGDIRVVKAPNTGDPIDLILVGAAANALGSNNSIIVHGGAELEITDPNALNGTNTLYLLSGSEGLMDLQDDARVLALNLGGTWNGGTGEVDDSKKVAPDIYTEATFAADYPGYVDYINFATDTTTLEVLTGPSAAIPEPAGLSLIGLAVLSLRRKRS